jgi:hypothetical protein
MALYICIYLFVVAPYNPSDSFSTYLYYQALSQVYQKFEVVINLTYAVQKNPFKSSRSRLLSGENTDRLFCFVITEPIKSVGKSHSIY